MFIRCTIILFFLSFLVLNSECSLYYAFFARLEKYIFNEEKPSSADIFSMQYMIFSIYLIGLPFLA